MKDNSADVAKPPSRWRAYWKPVSITAAVLLSIILLSCATMERTIVAPPEIPGAEFVGTHTCAECHEGPDERALVQHLGKLLGVNLAARKEDREGEEADQRQRLAKEGGARRHT